MTARVAPRPLPPNIRSVQPGGGAIMALELLWGRLRRAWLRRFARRYVERMTASRRSECPQCPHDIVDARDLKWFRNVCGFSFSPEADRFAWRDRLRIARMGLGEVVVLGGPLVVVAMALASRSSWLAAIPAALALCVAAFFRDPRRVIPQEAGSVVSPADGTVDDIAELEHFELLGGPAVRIGIFLSLASVHVNRAPERSRVIEVRYSPGRFRSAMKQSTAGENEQLSLLVATEEAPERLVLVRQIAGTIARRIVCEVRPGQLLARGEKFGMIKFGSRTEIYLPRGEGLTLQVKLGQRVRGGSSVLARFSV